MPAEKKGGLFDPTDLEVMLADPDSGAVAELDKLDLEAGGAMSRLFSSSPDQYPGRSGFVLTFVDGSEFEVDIKQTLGPRPAE